MRRGEVWLINLDPAVGSEIKKTRPAVIVNDDAIGILPLRVIVPITAWQERYTAAPWMFVWILIQRMAWISLQQRMRFKCVRSHKSVLCGDSGTFLHQLCKMLPELWRPFFPSREGCYQDTGGKLVMATIRIPQDRWAEVLNANGQSDQP